MTYHLAEYNIARLRLPLDAAENAEFASVLEAVNQIADALHRLAHLDEHGPRPHAFTFTDSFDPPVTAS